MNSRFEDKYDISESEKRKFLNFNRHLLLKDHEALSFNSSHVYQVNSLYYDTFDFSCYHQKLNGEQRKFKVRLRDYGNEKYLEIKLKDGMLGSKFRVELKGRIESDYQKLISYMDSNILKKFALPTDFKSYRPSVYVSYLREAYRLKNNLDVKINFDSQISFARNQNNITNKMNLQVLEIKQSKIKDDINLSFPRVKCEFSKYQKGVESVYFLN